MSSWAGRTVLFDEFCLEDRVPADHLLRRIDGVLDLSRLRCALAPYDSHTGCPSVDPELMMRMLLIGYCYSIRSERRLCPEVEMNLADKWFCRLGLEDKVPDHSTFSVNRHGRFRDSDVLRRVFDSVVRGCMDAGLVAGEGFAVDASETMIERTEKRFALKPDHVPGDTASGTGETLGALMARDITPHIPVWDKSKRDDGTLSRKDFSFDHERDVYGCPGGKTLTTTGRVHDGKTRLYRASTRDCAPCRLKQACCPNTPFRSIPRAVNEDARDDTRSLMGTEAYLRSARAQEDRDPVRRREAQSGVRQAQATRPDRGEG